MSLCQAGSPAGLADDEIADLVAKGNVSLIVPSVVGLG